MGSRLLRDPVTGRVKRGGAGRILRAVAGGNGAECPCCGQGCTCDNGNTLEACCCIPAGEPGSCASDAQRCEAPCQVPEGSCNCGASGPGIGLPSCCCLPLGNPASCASDAAQCVTPCNTKNGCTGCVCCASNCGYGLGAWSSSFSWEFKSYHDNPVCAQISAEEMLSTTCTGTISACGTGGTTGTCTQTGVLKEYTPGGTLKSHWEGTCTQTVTGSCNGGTWSTNASPSCNALWIVGPDPGGPRFVNSSGCNNVFTDACFYRRSSSGSFLPCNTCKAAYSCSRPACAGAAMGAAMHPGYAIGAGGVLAPIRAIEMARGHNDHTRCPVCSRTGWDGVWRGIESLRGERMGPPLPRLGRRTLFLGGEREAEMRRTQRQATEGTNMPGIIVRGGEAIEVSDAEFDAYTRDAAHATPARSRGLGDTVARAIDVVTGGRIKKTEGCGCQKRQEWLNKKVPWGKKREA